MMGCSEQHWQSLICLSISHRVIPSSMGISQYSASAIVCGSNLTTPLLYDCFVAVTILIRFLCGLGGLFLFLSVSEHSLIASSVCSYSTCCTSILGFVFSPIIFVFPFPLDVSWSVQCLALVTASIHDDAMSNKDFFAGFFFLLIFLKALYALCICFNFSFYLFVCYCCTSPLIFSLWSFFLRSCIVVS